MRRFKVKGKYVPVILSIQDPEKERRSSISVRTTDRLSDVQDVFHVSQLKKCLRVSEEQLSMEELNINEDLTYSE
jgi:hypothetical protein